MRKEPVFFVFLFFFKKKVLELNTNIDIHRNIMQDLCDLIRIMVGLTEVFNIIVYKSDFGYTKVTYSHETQNYYPQMFFSKNQKNYSIKVYYSRNSGIPVDIYQLKINNRNTRTKCEMCSKLAIFIVNSEHILHLVLEFLLLTLNM